MNPLIRHAFVSPDESIYHALKVIGRSPSFGGPTGIALVVQDDNHLLGILTDGDIRTLVIEYLQQFSPKVGFSDHTLVSRDGIKAAVAALYYGAEVVERHFTILDEDQTKDGPVSITPALLKKLVDSSRMKPEDLKEYVETNVPEYSTMIGARQRKLSAEELLNRDYYRGRFATKTSDGKTIYNWEE